MPKFELTRARAITADVLYVAALPRKADANVPFTRVCQFYQGKWDRADVDVATQRICLYHRPEGGRIAVYMSPEGQLFSPEPSFRGSRIVNSALATSKKLGRLADLRQVGKYLVACGDGGQTYRQRDDGGWVPLDLGVFDDRVDSTWAFAIRAPNVKTFAEEEVYFDNHPTEKAELDRRVKSYMANLMLHAIHGLSVDELYFCGKDGAVYFWNGHSSGKITVPTSSFLGDILVEDAETVWICGRDGTLLRGSAKRGFTAIPCDGSPQFSTITSFKGAIFLSSYAQPRGAFVYDGQRIRQVSSGLRQELDDVHTVDGVTDALWAVGSNAIARFDGATWEQIPLPK
ncbi:hypothetical protein ASG60_21255 [Methylobacterium sp. Leaf469]|uniref:hypothetical protein n=1 Tax=Methylobacterium sp. Leaf469 TaxID=1736387 RepID=UPI0006FDA248|nr:hypothetical protein [Methylobacterium sp. Leaf469]KQT92675.1 hypothetical protein ASG60_21255 [Methylobacterium sp. Leaf469]